jgi:hypothetical protein
MMPTDNQSKAEFERLVRDIDAGMKLDAALREEGEPPIEDVAPEKEFARDKFVPTMFTAGQWDSLERQAREMGVSVGAIIHAAVKAVTKP